MEEGCRSEKGEKEAQGGGEDEAGTVALEEDQAKASGGGEKCKVRGQERQWHVVGENRKRLGRLQARGEIGG